MKQTLRLAFAGLAALPAQSCVEPVETFSCDNVQGLFIVADSYSLSGTVQEDMLVK